MYALLIYAFINAPAMTVIPNFDTAELCTSAGNEICKEINWGFPHSYRCVCVRTK